MELQDANIRGWARRLPKGYQWKKRLIFLLTVTLLLIQPARGSDVDIKLNVADQYQNEGKTLCLTDS